MALIIGSKGPLSKATTAAQAWRRKLVFMPLTRIRWARVSLGVELQIADPRHTDRSAYRRLWNE